MKTKILNSLIVLVLFQLIFVVSINAEEIKKEKHETYTTTPNSVVNIENKFGDVDIENWTKNSVQIDVIITVDASSH